MSSNGEDTVGQVFPGFNLTQVISEAYPRIVYRAKRLSDGQNVIIKTLSDKFPKREHLVSVVREYNILQQVQLTGVVKLYELIRFGQGNQAMVMEDFGQSLKAYQTSFPNQKIPVKSFLNVAIQVVDALGSIHNKRIIHKDIHPLNILVDPKTAMVKIIDFHSATELTQEHLNPLNLTKKVEGSLPYISPEQTGRMNRDVDYRSDYYSLGASFFELLTGQLPFVANDPIEWVHAHISKPVKPIRAIRDDVPPMLSDIILKMMAKNAEDRYQSSIGLSHDLKRCLEACESGNTHDIFQLAEKDRSAMFKIPQKLYGREKELSLLEHAFENTVAGSVEFCLVYGYSGTGKTTLVNDLSKSITASHGYFVHGKFDQFKQNTAYAALTVAFRRLVHQLLGEPKERLDNWKSQIDEALGENAQLILDVIPELELLIGKKMAVQALSPAENQNRFVNLFISLIKVFATKNHPFVVFLDDLQWTDVPTLNLINRLVTSHELNHLLIIGAYRDNEVDATHPLSLTLRGIRKKRKIIDVSVKPLSAPATSELLNDTFIYHSGKTEELSNVVYEKTGGNPYFTVELLKNLHNKGVIFFNTAEGYWDWDMSQVRKVEFSDNVVDILVASQSELPEETLQILRLAACIGSEFDLKTLAIISELDIDKAGEAIKICLANNMLIPLDESYKYLGLGVQQDASNDGDIVNTFNPFFKFQHDRVQQAAYSQIPEAQRKKVHLSIGPLIIANSSPAELEDRLVEVVGHINQGIDLITNQADRFEFAQLNYIATLKAKQSSSYAEALKYAENGLKMLGENYWHQYYDLTWKLGNEVQHCAYLTGDLKKADHWSTILFQQATSPLSQALVLSSRTRQFATTGRMQESIESAFEGLSLLGFDFVNNPGKKEIQEEVDLISKNLNGREIASLIQMPEVRDEQVKIANQLIMEIFAAAFLSGSGEMFPYLVLKSVNIAMTSGNSPESAFAYAAYAMILCGYFEDTKKGHEYGKLAVDMIDGFDDISLRSRILYLYTMFVHHWSNHWSSMTPWFHKVIEAGYQSGDLLYLAYGAQDCIIWDPKLDLQTASEEHRKLLAIVEECDYQDSLDSGTLFLQMQLNFQGLTEGQYALSDARFSENACLIGMQDRKFMTGIGNYRIYKAEIHLMYNDAKGGIEYILEQDKHIASVMALPQMVRFHVVSFLTRSLLLDSVDEITRKEHLIKMMESYACMCKWSEQCADNYEHLALLMQAELEKDSKNLEQTIVLYDKAIAKAHEHYYRRDEAMANEFAAIFLRKHGLIKASSGYLESAHYIYYQWGAQRKVKEMEERYAQVLHTRNRESRGITSSISLNTTSLSQSFNSELLDMDSVLRASQVISGELVLGKLLKATLKILIENAGAQRGCLVELKDGLLHVKAYSEIEHEDNGNGDSTMDLPIALVSAVIRGKSPIVIANASETNAYSSDPYIKHNQPLSVMCIPLPSHGRSNVAVYLENNITHSVFTEKRVEVIKMLAGQAAISLENARIYEEQKILLNAQQRFVPTQFLKHLGHEDIARVKLGESVGMEMSVLFSDVRDFTNLVEQLSPHAVIQLLNRYYSRLGNPIFNAGGFIDSYAGDALLALFAIPAQQAVRAGIEMAEELRRFNDDAVANNQTVLRMGIGMNTGPLVLGTMGADERMQCSVLGDTVNLASRIEQLTKNYDAQFIIGENTFKALTNPHEFSIRKVDRVAVKGKAQAVDLFEVLDAEETLKRDGKEATKALLLEAQAHYYNREFALAYRLLIDALNIDPSDRVLQIYCDRTLQFMETPPDVDWEGFEKLLSKN